MPRAVVMNDNNFMFSLYEVIRDAHYGENNFLARYAYSPDVNFVYRRIPYIIDQYYGYYPTEGSFAINRARIGNRSIHLISFKVPEEKLKAYTCYDCFYNPRHVEVLNKDLVYEDAILIPTFYDKRYHDELKSDNYDAEFATHLYYITNGALKYIMPNTTSQLAAVGLSALLFNEILGNDKFKAVYFEVYYTRAMLYECCIDDGSMDVSVEQRLELVDDIIEYYHSNVAVFLRNLNPISSKEAFDIGLLHNTLTKNTKLVKENIAEIVRFDKENREARRAKFKRNFNTMTSEDISNKVFPSEENAFDPNVED